MWDKDHKILLFDGVCNLCNSTVNFVINRDRKKQIRYAAIQSPAGKKLLMKYNISPNYLSSLIFIDQEKVFLNSSGALRLCLYLKPLWPLMYVFIIVPPMLRNAGNRCAPCLLVRARVLHSTTRRRSCRSRRRFPGWRGVRR